MKGIDKFNYTIAALVVALFFFTGHYSLGIKIWLGIWWLIVAISTVVWGRSTPWEND